MILESISLRSQRLAVDQGAIATTQVAHADCLTAQGELGVFATDLFAVRPEVAGLSAAYLERGADQRDDLSLGLASYDDQLHFHGNRPDLNGLQR